MSIILIHNNFNNQFIKLIKQNYLLSHLVLCGLYKINKIKLDINGDINYHLVVFLELKYYINKNKCMNKINYHILLFFY